MSTNRIEKNIVLRAPRSRVWRAIAGGTGLTVIESGFDRIPLARRAEAFRMNDRGWTEQMKNIERHVAG
jgi:uncharacterized protein YndB with AHSA1/START domain